MKEGRKGGRKAQWWSPLCLDRQCSDALPAVWEDITSVKRCFGLAVTGSSPLSSNHLLDSYQALSLQKLLIG